MFYYINKKILNQLLKIKPTTVADINSFKIYSLFYKFFPSLVAGRLVQTKFKVPAILNRQLTRSIYLALPAVLRVTHPSGSTTGLTQSHSQARRPPHDPQSLALEIILKAAP